MSEIVHFPAPVQAAALAAVDQDLQLAMTDCWGAVEVISHGRPCKRAIPAVRRVIRGAQSIRRTLAGVGEVKRA